MTPDMRERLKQWDYDEGAPRQRIILKLKPSKVQNPWTFAEKFLAWAIVLLGIVGLLLNSK